MIKSPYYYYRANVPNRLKMSTYNHVLYLVSQRLSFYKMNHWLQLENRSHTNTENTNIGHCFITVLVRLRPVAVWKYSTRKPSHECYWCVKYIFSTLSSVPGTYWIHFSGTLSIYRYLGHVTQNSYKRKLALAFIGPNPGLWTN